MKRIDIKREIRRYYGLQNRKIKINYDRKSFIVIVGDCVCCLPFPPVITRHIKLEELGI